MPLRKEFANKKESMMIESILKVIFLLFSLYLFFNIFEKVVFDSQLSSFKDSQFLISSLKNEVSFMFKFFFVFLLFSVVVGRVSSVLKFNKEYAMTEQELLQESED